MQIGHIVTSSSSSNLRTKLDGLQTNLKENSYKPSLCIYEEAICPIIGSYKLCHHTQHHTCNALSSLLNNTNVTKYKN